MRFLFASTPVKAHSTNPLPFAARLVEDGHDVWWYAGREFAAAIESVGAHHVPMPVEVDLSVTETFQRYEHLLTGQGVSQIRQTFAEYFYGTVPTSVQAIERFLLGNPVDVVLSDGVMLAPRYLHERGGPVWASYGDGPLPVSEPGIPPFGPGLRYLAGPFGRVRNAVVRRVARRIFAPVDAARDTIRTELMLGPDLRPAMDLEMSPYLHLQGCTPGFEYPVRRLPPQVHWIGPLRPDPVDWVEPEWWDRIVDSKLPVVHVSQGSLRSDMTELIVPTVQALRDERMLIVVTTGGPTAAELERLLGWPLPNNVIATPFVPYDELLRHADVFVTNGGYTGLTLALSHGVPIVQAGTTEEKAENGARVDYSGVGISLRTNRPSIEQLSTAVGRVLARSSYVEAAGRIALEMAEHDAGREGADRLIALAATQRPVLAHTEPVGRHAPPRLAPSRAEQLMTR